MLPLQEQNPDLLKYTTGALGHDLTLKSADFYMILADNLASNL